MANTGSFGHFLNFDLHFFQSGGTNQNSSLENPTRKKNPKHETEIIKKKQ